MKIKKKCVLCVVVALVLSAVFIWSPVEARGITLYVCITNETNKTVRYNYRWFYADGKIDPFAPISLAPGSTETHRASGSPSRMQFQFTTPDASTLALTKLTPVDSPCDSSFSYKISLDNRGRLTIYQPR